MSWTSGSPTTNRRAFPAATATFMPIWNVWPPGVRTSGTVAIARCMSSPHATASVPSSPSSQQVTASPLK
jgi:hypothetical protein